MLQEEDLPSAVTRFETVTSDTIPYPGMRRATSGVAFLPEQYLFRKNYNFVLPALCEH